MGSIGLFLGFLFSLFVGTNALAFGPIGCDPDHCRPPNLPPSRVSVKECRAPTGQSLNQPVKSFEEVFRYLRLSGVASEKLLQFKSLYQQKKLKIEDFTDEVRERIKAKPNIKAFFEFVPGREFQSLYVDFKEELGILSIHFYHEMIHSLDPELSSFYNEFDQRYPEIQEGIKAVYQAVADRLNLPLSRVSTMHFTPDDFQKLRLAKKFENDGVYRAEFLAFSEQSKMIQDLGQTVTCLDQYIQDHKRSNELNLHIRDIQGHLYIVYGLYPPE